MSDDDDNKVLPFPVQRIDELAKSLGFAFRYYTLVNRVPVVIDTPVQWAEEIARRTMMQRDYDVDPWRVDETFIGQARVSTVFIGLDHRMGGDGPPALFETMIFGGRLDEFQNRCCTWDEAERMHAEAVRLVRGGHLRVIK